MKSKVCKIYKNGDKIKKLEHDWILSARNNQVCSSCGFAKKPTKKFLKELDSWKKLSSKFNKG